MISYKDFFKVLITTDHYISVDTIKLYIENNKDNPLSETALNKELLRKFDRFVKAGLLHKRYNGTHTVYTRTELTKQIHQTYGTNKLLSAYMIVELSKDNEFAQVINNLGEILTIDDTPGIGFYSQHPNSFDFIKKQTIVSTYNFINSFLHIMSS